MTELIINVVLLAVFLVILVRSAMFAIESVVKFSKITGIGELAAGFVIVAVSTSVPEISVAVFSTTSENVGITLGDIFGSNVTNIGLITALFLLFSPVRKIETKTIRSFIPLLLAASLIPLFLLLAQQGSKFIGIALLAAFAFFIYRISKSNIEQKQERQKGSPHKSLFYFLIGIAIVIVSAKIIVDSASAIAEMTGLRESVIGATIIALGTSLPELAVDVMAVRKKHLDLALGDIIGSCITNITLVLGIVLVLSTVEINFGILSTLVSFAIILPFVLFVLLRRGNIAKWQSVSLFAMYAIFLIVIYEIQAIIGGINL
jgi:cation:H+ antiporter